MRFLILLPLLVVVALPELATAQEREAGRGSAPDAAAMEEFLDNYIGFQDWVGTDSTGVVVGHWSTPFLGEDRNPLTGVAFYEVLERDDLVAEYRKRRSRRLLVMLCSAAPIVGGAALIVANAAGSGHKAPYIAGGIIAGAGVAGMIAAASMNLEPIDAATARALARDYNLRLADRLNVPPELSGMPMDESAVRSSEPTSRVLFGAGAAGPFVAWSVRF